jgi:hypothetical protein
MKTITTFFAAFFCCMLLNTASAQFLFKPNAAICNAVQQVLTDFPNQLQNITGALVQDDVQRKDYTSKVNFPGAESCVVTQYNSKKDKSRSWQAVMPEVESFAAAKKQYKDLYNQVKNMGIKLNDGAKAVKPSGSFEEPKEEKKFARSIFRFSETDETYKNVKIEVSLHYLITGWQVSIYVYDKKEDDEILPEAATANDY